MNNMQNQLELWRYLTTVHVPGFPKLSTQICDLSDKSSNQEVDDSDEDELDQEEEDDDDEDEDFDS